MSDAPDSSLVRRSQRVKAGEWTTGAGSSGIASGPHFFVRPYDRLAPTERSQAMEASRSSKRSSGATRSKRTSGNGGPPRSNGSAKKSSVAAELESFNPATGELVGTVPTLTPRQVQAVVDDVAEVQPFWAQLSLEDRSRYMRRAVDV